MSKKKEKHDEVFKRPEECFSGKAKVVVFPPDFLQNFGFIASGDTVVPATKSLVNKTTPKEAKHSVEQFSFKKSSQLKYCLKQKTNTSKQKKEKSHIKKVSEAHQDKTIQSELEGKKLNTDRELSEPVNSVNDCCAPRNSLKENADAFPVLRRALSENVECSLVSKTNDQLQCKEITEPQESSILETCCLLKESVALSPSFTDTFIPNVNVSKRYNEQTNISNMSAYQHPKVDESEHFKPVLIQVPTYEINNENETFLLQPLSKGRDSDKSVTETAIYFNPAKIFMVNKYETVIAPSPVAVTSHVNSSSTTTLQSQHASQVVEYPKVTNIAQEEYSISRLDDVTAINVQCSPVIGTCTEQAHLSNSIRDNCIDVSDLDYISKVSILKAEIIKPAILSTTTSTIISNSSAEDKPVTPSISTPESSVETNKELSVLESVDKISVAKPKLTHTYRNKRQKCKNNISQALPNVHKTINTIEPKSYLVTSKKSLHESDTTNSENVSLDINTDMLQEESTLHLVGICGKVFATQAQSASEDEILCKVITEKENMEWILKSQPSNKALKSQEMKDPTTPVFKTISHPTRSFSKNNEHFLPEQADCFEDSETHDNSSKKVVDNYMNTFENRARESNEGSRLQYKKTHLMKTYERKRKFVNCAASSTQGVEKPGGIVNCNSRISEVKNKIVTYGRRRKNATLKTELLQNVKNEPHLQVAQSDTCEHDPSKLIIDCEMTSDTHTIDFQMFNMGSKFSMNFELKDNEVKVNLDVGDQTSAMICSPGNVTYNCDSGMIFSGCNEKYLEKVLCDKRMSNYSMPIIENELENPCGSETIFNAEENVELFQNILPNKSTELMVSTLLTEDLLKAEDCHPEDIQPPDLIAEQYLNFDKFDAFRYDRDAFDTFENIASNGDDSSNIRNIEEIGYSAVTPLDNIEIPNENVEVNNDHIYNFSNVQMLPNKIYNVLGRSQTKNVLERYFENNNKTGIESNFKAKDLGNCGSDNAVSSFIKNNKVEQEKSDIITTKNEKLACRTAETKHTQVESALVSGEDNTVTGSPLSRYTRLQSGNSLSTNLTEIAHDTLVTTISTADSRKGNEEVSNVNTLRPDTIKKRKGRPPKRKQVSEVNTPVNIIEDNAVPNTHVVRCTRRQRGDISITLNVTEPVGDSITKCPTVDTSRHEIKEENNIKPTQCKRQRGRPPKPKHNEHLDVQSEFSQGSSQLTESSTNTITALKVLKCGVCIKEIMRDEWLLHCAREHNYLAWRDGDTPINLADDECVIQHLRGIAKCRSHFECAVCASKWRSPEKFWLHVRRCTDEDQNCISHETETLHEPVHKATMLQASIQNGEAEANEMNKHNNDEVLKQESIESKLTCGVCQWQGNETDWMNHIFREHNYLAWRYGEQSLDLNNDGVVHDHLKLILQKLSKLKCRMCGIERKYVRSFLKHCKICVGSEQPDSVLTPRLCRSHEGDTLPTDATTAASEESVQNKSRTRRISVDSDSDNISLKKLKDKRVRCGRCREEVNSLKWLDHLIEHNYLAWQEGETPIEVECERSATGQLRVMLGRHGLLTCRLCRSSLTTLLGYQYHTRRCEDKSKFVSSPTDELRRRYVRKSDLVTPTSQQPTTDPVKCAVCSEVMPNKKWRSHLERVHYNLAWFEGGIPFDIKDFHTSYIILNDLIKKLKKLECIKCGETRMSGAGFYAHIIVCGKTDEEIEAMKVPCPKCERKVLPQSKSQHMLTHRTSAAAAPSPEDTSHADTGGRRRAALAAQASIEKITSVLVESKRSCSQCNYVAYTDEELKKHRCGSDNFKNEDYSSAEDTNKECRWESESEGSDSAGDSNLSVQESSRIFSEDEDDSRPSSSVEKKKDKSIERHAYRPGKENKLLNGPSFRKFIEDFCATHFTTDLLYPELRCNKFEVVPAHEVARYKPPLLRSCYMFHQTSHSKTTQWKSYDLFHSEFESGTHTFFVGGAVAGFSFVPPVDRMSCEPAEHYISITCQPDASVEGLMHNELHSHPGLIQIWNFGKFEREERARFVLGLAHDYGTVWALDWCPSGAREPPAGAAGRASELRRLGLMAAACSNGSVYIFAVCHPEQLTESETSMYRTTPVLELQLCSDGQCRSNYQATAVHWSTQKGHSIVSVGYSDGVVALYDLNTGSPILRRIKDDVPILNPFFDSQLMDSAVSPSLLQRCRLARGAGSAPDSVAVHLPDHDTIDVSRERALVTEEAPRAACLHARRVAVATLAHQLLLLRFYPNSDLVRRNILATFEMTPLEANKYAMEKANENLEVVLEPSTYDEAVKKYGIKWTSHRRWVEVEKADLYPLASVTAIAFCPCRCHFNQLAWGGLAGLVHIIQL